MMTKDAFLRWPSRAAAWLLASGLLILWAAPVASAASGSRAPEERMVRSAELLAAAGAGDLAREILSRSTGVPVRELDALDRPMAEIARAAVVSAISGLQVERAAAWSRAGVDLGEVEARFGLDASETRVALLTAASSLEAAIVTLGLPAMDPGHSGDMGPGHGGGEMQPEHDPNDPSGGPGEHTGEEHCGDGFDSGPGHDPHDASCEPEGGPESDHPTDHGPHHFDGEECEHGVGPGPHGHGCDTEFSEEFAVDPFVCEAGDQLACLGDGRFEVTVQWADFQDRIDHGRPLGLGSPSSELFWFFDPENFELLVKVLDGCAINGNFWVMTGAATNVEYSLTVIDSISGLGKTYFSPLNHRSRAIADTEAFACN